MFLLSIRRDGRYGEMTVNGQNAGNITSQGDMEELSIGNEIFLGGYAEGRLPTNEVQDMNFEGCIQEFYFGPEEIDLSENSPGAYGVQPGCQEGEVNLVTFPAASPGYMQLNR